MPEEVNPVNQTPAVTTTPQTKPPVNWKLIGIISVVAAIVIAGLGYGAVVLNLFGGQTATETIETNKVATKSSEQNKTTTTSEKEEQFVFYRQSASIPYSVVYSVKTNGTSEIRLAENVPPSSGGQCCDSKISRDSLLMAFTSDHNLWVVGLNGKGVKQLTTTGRDFTTQFLPIDVTIIDWSPDDSKILYYLRSVPNQMGGLYPNTPSGAIEDPSVKYGIYLYDLTKGKSSYVTKDLETDGWLYVGWPKGTEKALFNIGRLNSPESSEYIYALNVNDSSFTKFSNQKYQKFWTPPASISEDGKLIVWKCGYSDSTNVGEQVCFSNIDGTQKRAIASGQWNNHQSPRFLPGNTYISFRKDTLTADLAPNLYEFYLYDTTTGKMEKKYSTTFSGASVTWFFLNKDTLLISKDNNIIKIDLLTSKETILAKTAYFNFNFYH